METSPVHVLDFTNVTAANKKICANFDDWCKTYQYPPPNTGDLEMGTAPDMKESWHLNKQIKIAKWEEALACFLLFLFPGVIVWLPLVAIICLFVFSWKFIVPCIAVAVIITYLVPVRYLPSICSSYILRLFARYFSLRIISLSKLDETATYLFGNMPHGVFPIGDMLSLFAFLMMAQRVPRYACSWALIYLPVLRNIFGAYGAISASRSRIVETLREHQSVSLNLPGLAGIYDSADTRQTIQLQNRRGFIRAALAVGNVSLVPVYIFGNTECLSSLFTTNRFMRALSRFLRFPLTWIYGRCYLPIAQRTPILIAIGKPILVDTVPTEHPSEELIEYYHKRFVDGLIDVYHRCKGYYGWEHMELRIK